MLGLGLAHESPSNHYMNLKLGAENLPNEKSVKSSSSNHIANGHGNPHSCRKEDLPFVRSLPNTAGVEEVVDALKVSGGVVIRNAVSNQDIDVIESKGPHLLGQEKL